MNVRQWLKATIGAAALGTLMLSGACSTSGGGTVYQDDYHSGVWQTGRPMKIGEPAPAPAPRAEAPRERAEPRAEPVRRQSTAGCTPDVGPNETVTSQAFPTGDVASSGLIVHTIMPREVRVNQPYEYRLQVCNLTSGDLQNVVVVHENQNNFELISSNPQASRGADGNPQWVLGNLGPNESRIITVTARADRTGVSSNCITATYNNLLCAETTVVEPALALRKTATPEALICDPIEITYVVTNTGTGDCDNVVVRDQLPEGLTVNGQRTVSFDAGNLAAGQSREFKVSAKAGRTGRFSSPASATSGCGADANAEAVSTVVTQPVLAIEAECINRVYLGRNVTFKWTVTNSGDAASQNTVVTAPVPAGSEFVSASSGGTLQGGNVVWNVGTLAATNGSREISMDVRPTGIGTLRAVATAAGVCAEQVADGCETDVQGIPAILLEVVDDPDPVRVGDTTTYIIQVKNQGSATDRNIRIVCTLPAEQEYVSSTGATQSSVSGRTITFAPLPSLAPQQTVTWRVTVRAVAAGNIRFGTSMTSDSFERPIEETEATYLYE